MSGDAVKVRKVKQSLCIGRHHNVKSKKSKCICDISFTVWPIYPRGIVFSDHRTGGWVDLRVRDKLLPSFFAKYSVH